ncbi:unnamed protein product [Rotaria socialis]|uniref:Uncharacterized protein n=1 Tax=Rotaria socialis TaxID=392032 RepID=A0A818L1I2_9BILA|nr:unnamed protein product [Rotaria socialis]CAF3569626.1 unnamed protein product [Rotaria socialis]
MTGGLSLVGLGLTHGLPNPTDIFCEGVNDAQALAKANVGVAVADACDAARSAFAIVLTEPCLSVIIDAILAIVWVYDIIWFLPLDFVTCDLQIAFARSPTAVKTFNQCCECCFSKICKGNAIAPENVTTIQITSHNPPVHQLSKINNDVATQIQSHTQEKSITKINEIAEFGAPYYKPHTDILTGLKQQVFMARSFSQ